MLVDFYFAQKTFFPKNLLPNSGCGLSTDAAYTRVNTVNKISNVLRKDLFSSSVYNLNVTLSFPLVLFVISCAKSRCRDMISCLKGKNYRKQPLPFLVVKAL